MPTQTNITMTTRIGTTVIVRSSRNDVEVYDDVSSASLDARKRMNELGHSRGFYLLVALAPGPMPRSQQLGACVCPESGESQDAGEEQSVCAPVGGSPTMAVPGEAMSRVSISVVPHGVSRERLRAIRPVEHPKETDVHRSQPGFSCVGRSVSLHFPCF